MADNDDSQKTEDPTGRKLQEARDQGQVAKSQEVNNLLMILALTISVVVFGGSMARDIVNMSLPFIETPDMVPTDLGHLTTMGWKLLGLGLLAVTLSSMMIWFLDSYERQIAPFLSQ